MIFWYNTLRGNEIRITLPYHFLIGESTKIDPHTDTSATISAAQPFHEMMVETGPQRPALQLKPHQGISLVRESFPDTFQLFESLPESNSLLKESFEEI